MPVIAECLPLIGYVADCRYAVCNEGHLCGVATLVGTVFVIRNPFPMQCVAG
ncbi:hypothetical protein [Coprobacter secundus]|uniref:hypothetical protein n=1 Tax=Coprobacter secundus TaxID=1501392 RepID=UPI000AB4C71B